MNRRQFVSAFGLSGIAGCLRLQSNDTTTPTTPSTDRAVTSTLTDSPTRVQTSKELGSPTPTATPSPTTPTDTPTPTPVVNTTGLVNYGLSWSDYDNQFDKLTNDGYRPVLTSGYNVGFRPRFLTIWESDNGESWESEMGLTSSQFSSWFDTLSAEDGADMMMTHVTGYADGSEGRYGGIWRPQPPSTGWWELRNMSADDFQSANEKRAEDSLYISYICGYNIAGADLYAALWHEFTSSDRVVELGLSDTGFDVIHERRKGEGYRPVVISGYTIQGDPRYAGIWEDSQVDDWILHKRLTGSELTSKLEEYDEEGLQLLHLDGYGIQGEARYAGIWETPF